MDIKWDAPLKEGQVSNPILEYYNKGLDKEFLSRFSEDDFNSVLNAKAKHQLKTWGGSDSTAEPHWIGCKKGTPLHTDPRYPRYSWQLILKVDNFCIRGKDKEETKLEAGMLFLLDTHSPHQLWALSKDATYYFACSMDSKEYIPMEIAYLKLHSYVQDNEILNDTNRIQI